MKKKEKIDDLLKKIEREKAENLKKILDEKNKNKK